jgi:hypothetical protein
MFVLASAVAGIAGGGISIFFWKASRYCKPTQPVLRVVTVLMAGLTVIGGWGGFALALWIQCFHNGGLINTIGFRWIFYIGTLPRYRPHAHLSLFPGCGVVGFVLCTIPKVNPPNLSGPPFKLTLARYITTYCLFRQQWSVPRPSCWAWTASQLPDSRRHVADSTGFPYVFNLFFFSFTSGTLASDLSSRNT